MIEVKNLTKEYTTKKAVDDITFTVEPGQIFGFLGPNGAGKSTTIKSIIGLIEPTRGEIRLNGISIYEDELEYKKQFSYVPDNPELFEKLTGYEYINFLSDIFGVDSSTRQERLEYYLGYFDIKDAMGNQIMTYSHGMKQRLAIIGALINDPNILILDEPMVGLDARSAFNLKEIMRQRADNGKIVFFSTHVMDVAQNLCDEIAIINHGKIIARGTFDEIKAQSHREGTLEKIFLELTENE